MGGQNFAKPIGSQEKQCNTLIIRLIVRKLI